MIRKIAYLLSFTLLLPLFSKQAFATSDWVVTNFTQQIYLHQDTTVDVVERIDVDFKNTNKHGIYRDIPVNYKDSLGNNLDIRFDLGWVSEDGERPETINQSKIGDNIRVKLGSESYTKSGPHTYTISYTIKRVITRPSDYAEFYWNSTGFDWEVPINEVQVIVYHPNGSVLDTVCYKGVLGSVTRVCFTKSSIDTSEFKTNQVMPSENLTISLKLNPQSFTFPTIRDEIIWFIEDNWAYVLPILTFMLMLVVYSRKGRDRVYQDLFHYSDERTKLKPLLHRESPALLFGPNTSIPPGVVGTIADERVHLRDFTATIIDLARRGFITIEEQKSKLLKKSNYIFTYNKKDESNLIDYEKKVLSTFFGTTRLNNPANLKKLPKSSYRYYDEALNSLYEYVYDNGYFVSNPKFTRNRYLFFSVFVIAMGFIAFSNLSFNYAMPIMLSGLVILPFSFFMPARTAKGSRVLREIIGFKEWIRIGAWRQKIHEKHNFIEEVLPYTIAFGLTYKFLNAIKNSDLQNLEWYKSSAPINVNSFTNSISSIGYKTSDSINATRPKSSSSGGSSFSGGGGFSGGGFGGGGGGSW